MSYKGNHARRRKIPGGDVPVIDLRFRYGAYGSRVTSVTVSSSQIDRRD